MDTLCLPQSLAILSFETASLSEPGAHGFDKVDWPVDYRGTPFSSPQHWSSRCVLLCPAFVQVLMIGGSHACPTTYQLSHIVSLAVIFACFWGPSLAPECIK